MLAPDVGTSQIASVASAPEAAPVLGEQRGFLGSFLGSCPLLQEIQLSALPVEVGILLGLVSSKNHYRSYMPLHSR